MKAVITIWILMVTNKTKDDNVNTLTVARHLVYLDRADR